MTAGQVLLPTLGVLLAWFCVAAVLAGCGFLARRALLAVFSESSAAGLVPADVWIGLAVVLVYVQFWNLFFAVGWGAWPVPVGAGIVGLALAARSLRGSRLPRPAGGGLALLGIGVFWLANRALAPTADYDYGLYHQNLIGYALKYATIPGLGNLHYRLAAGDAHLLLVALLDHGPLAGAAPRLVNGLLVALLLVEIATRLLTHTAGGWPSTLSGRMALLLLPATLGVVGLLQTVRLSSPNLDVAAFVLVVVGMLYLAEHVEAGFSAVAAVTAMAALASASVTRPLYWITTLLVLVAIVWFAGRRHGWSRLPVVQAASLVCVLPGALVLGWTGRQAMLSGYPLYPLTFGGLPVDWRMPASLVQYDEDLVRSWARWPGLGPNQVGGLGMWLPHWLRLERKNLDLVGPLVLLACVIPSLAARNAAAREERRRRLPQMLALLIPALVTTVAWFLLAPDPRFGLAAIWLVPIVLVAWALPSAAGAGRTLARVAVIAAVLVVAGLVWERGDFGPVRAIGGGLFGGSPPPVILQMFTTSSGLQVGKPADGGDQCFQALLCTPYPNADLRLRGGSIRQGFRVVSPG